MTAADLKVGRIVDLLSNENANAELPAHITRMGMQPEEIPKKIRLRLAFSSERVYL